MRTARLIWRVIATLITGNASVLVVRHHPWLALCFAFACGVNLMVLSEIIEGAEYE